MKKNIGSVDKLVRILIATLIAILYFANLISGSVAIILLILAGVFLLTSFLNFCPIWYAFGISTRSKES